MILFGIEAYESMASALQHIAHLRLGRFRAERFENGRCISISRRGF